MKELLEKIRRAATEEMSQAGADLEEIRIKYLGKKGELTALLRQMGSLSAEERPVIGQLANEVRSSIEAELDKLRAAAKEKAREAALRAEKIDVTVPGAEIPTGHRHPLDRVQHEIEDIFIGMGYSIAEGPEVELDYYNFQALNIPADHPARDTQDTFYILPRAGARDGETAPADPHPLPRTGIPLRRGRRHPFAPLPPDRGTGCR